MPRGAERKTVLRRFVPRLSLNRRKPATKSKKTGIAPIVYRPRKTTGGSNAGQSLLPQCLTILASRHDTANRITMPCDDIDRCIRHVYKIFHRPPRAAPSLASRCAFRKFESRLSAAAHSVPAHWPSASWCCRPFLLALDGFMGHAVCADGHRPSSRRRQ